MAIEHRSIPESGLHEPKGASTAAENRVYISNGSGSGSWGKIVTAVLEGALGTSPANGRFVITDGSGGLTSVVDISSDDITYGGGTLTSALTDIETTTNTQQSEIDALETENAAQQVQIDDLESQVADLETRVTALENA